MTGKNRRSRKLKIWGASRKGKGELGRLRKENECRKKVRSKISRTIRTKQRGTRIVSRPRMNR